MAKSNKNDYREGTLDLFYTEDIFYKVNRPTMLPYMFTIVIVIPSRSEHNNQRSKD